MIMSRYHRPKLSPNQCGSSLTQTIEAPISLVWSFIRRFDNPKCYKPFVKSCSILDGNGGIGSIREVQLVSGLPAKTTMERLDELDDDSHVMVYSMVGWDGCVVNCRSTTTVHEVEVDADESSDVGKTLVIESYVADLPMGTIKEDACVFADTIIRFNLRSLASVTEKIASVSN